MEQEVKEKKCPRCGELLPARMFGEKSIAKTGLQSWCKRCTNLYTALRREYRDVGGVKVCSKCRRILPVTMFPDGGKMYATCKGETLKSNLFSIDSCDDWAIFDALRVRGWSGALERITKEEIKL